VEIRVILRGALAGAFAGLLGFVFEHIFAEPWINKAIAYEYKRDAVLTAMNHAAGRQFSVSDPEIFSRATQSSIGAASALIGFGVAMGALVAVVYLVLHGRMGIRPRNLVWAIAGFGFLGVYLLPFVKYPANPPSIGHPFTIHTRGQLYVVMVVGSLVLLGLAVFLGRRLMPRFGAVGATVLAGVAFLVAYSILIGVLPSLGDLNANLAQVHQFGYARAATETPQPIVNILSRPLTFGGKTYAPGQVVYPGFDADVLWKFRWYSVINQVLVWTVLALGFGALLDRLDRPRRARPAGSSASAADAADAAGAAGQDSQPAKPVEAAS
jgi:Probable cobalt transporter subunit (CbtA)